jgi:hypothetical protein
LIDRHDGAEGAFRFVPPSVIRFPLRQSLPVLMSTWYGTFVADVAERTLMARRHTGHSM